VYYPLSINSNKQVDEDKVKKKKQIEDENVDIITIDKISYFSSEDEDELLVIPLEINKE
jgi:hypothetical protein